MRALLQTVALVLALSLPLQMGWVAADVVTDAQTASATLRSGFDRLVSLLRLCEPGQWAHGEC